MMKVASLGLTPGVSAEAGVTTGAAEGATAVTVLAPVAVGVRVWVTGAMVELVTGITEATL